MCACVHTKRGENRRKYISMNKNTEQTENNVEVKEKQMHEEYKECFKNLTTIPNDIYIWMTLGVWVCMSVLV